MIPFVGLSACDTIFSIGNNPGVGYNYFSYKVSTNLTQKILTPIVISYNIARTNNRFWLENGSLSTVTQIREYSLVESPYSVSLIRTIPVNNTSVGVYWYGYFALNNTTLLAGSGSYPSSLYSIDITSTAVTTFKWNTPATRAITANILYTTNGRVLYLNMDTSASQITYITQKVYSTGVQEFDVQIGSAGDTFRNMFQEGNSIYVTKLTGQVYRVNPSNLPSLTLVGSVTVVDPTNVGGAAQRSSCITIPILPSSWGTV